MKATLGEARSDVGERSGKWSTRLSVAFSIPMNLVSCGAKKKESSSGCESLNQPDENRHPSEPSARGETHLGVGSMNMLLSSSLYTCT